MSEKINLAKYKKFGKEVEISVDPDLALRFKQGENIDISEILHSEHIFTDVKKGLIASPKELSELFGTEDVLEVAAKIIKEGEIQGTAEHRTAEREQKFRRIVQTIHDIAIDPRTNAPHTIARIEAALEQGKVRIDYNKNVDEQLNEIIYKLRPIIPLSIELVKLQVIIPALYVGKSYNIIKNNSKLLKEEWKYDGSWSARVEIPAGKKQDLIDKINAITHGEADVENV